MDDRLLKDDSFISAGNPDNLRLDKIADGCPSKEVLVTIQDNGIIRGPKGNIIGRLLPDIVSHLYEDLEPYKSQK